MTKTRTIFLIMSVFAVTAGKLPAASDDSDSPIVIITQEGIVPVRTKGTRSRNSVATCYLRSAVEPQARVHAACSTSSAKPAKPTPTPKPKATPAPKIIAKQLPPAVAVATPKPKATPTPTPAATPTPTLAPAKITVVKPAKVQAAKSTGKSTAPANDDLDEYSDVALIADPIEPVNRGIFWVNHQFYRYILKPVSRTYDTILPKPVRKGVYNVFDNLEYPVRFVNDLLQCKFQRAGKETGKFVVNSTAGVAGIMKVSDRIPALTDVPPEDTGQTFAQWGIGHGPYIVLPLIGPKSLRETVGFAGDVALSPVTWVTFGVIGGLGGATSLAVNYPNTARSMNGRMSAYDAVTKDAVDPYLATRSGYVQSRKQAVSK
jgi:phospholipid-binding lipoprotein MlaA